MRIISYVNLFFLLLVSPSFANESWKDLETGYSWVLLPKKMDWATASKECTKFSHGKLPPRLLSYNAINNLFSSPLAEKLPYVLYRLGGIVGEEYYLAKVIWMQEHVTDPVYKDIWFVGALVENSTTAYSQPHVQDSKSLFSVICLTGDDF